MQELVVWQRWVLTGKDDADDARVASAAASNFAERAAALGGKTFVLTSGTSCVAFDSDDLRDVLTFVVGWLEEFEQSEANLRFAFGVALGDLSGDKVVAGDAIDRAQVFAGRARPGEIVVDPMTQRRAQAYFLFARTVNAGAGSLRGHVVDRAFPYRHACRDALATLRVPDIAPNHAPFLDRIRELAGTDGSPRLLLRGPAGAGVRSWMSALVEELAPPLVLRLHSVPGGIEPLGSLRVALLSRFGNRDNADDRTTTRVQLDDVTQRVLMKITNGEPTSRDDALRALIKLLEASRKGSERPWLMLDPLDAIDPASLELVSDAVGPAGADAFLLGRLPIDMRPPASLLRGGPVEDMRVPPLRTADSRAIAESILPPNTHADIVRRVAELGGDSPLGVLTAARTLVATGDLIHHEDALYWRATPRTNAGALSLRAMWSEHAQLLPTASYRALELIAACPEGARTSFVRACLKADSADPDETLEELQRESLITTEDPPSVVSRFLRLSLTESMSAARKKAVHSIIADELTKEMDPKATFRHATLGHYLFEAQENKHAAEAFLAAATAASKMGYARAAVRLAAAAVRADGTPGVRDAAATIMSDADTYTPHPSTHPLAESATNPRASAAPAVQSAVQAILARDFDAVDRAVETAVARGGNPAVADRVRAVAELARGDVAAAMRMLSRARKLPESSQRGAARAALTLALVLLESGDSRHAVRAALGALASARAAADARGELAALRALAQCYRALGREADAAKLERATAT